MSADSLWQQGIGENARYRVEIARLGDFVVLLKPRVMSLVVFTGVAGMLAAPGALTALHPLLAIVAILCIAASAGGAGAINMWYDRDIDLIMERTRERPLPQGRIDPSDALAFGVILTMGSFMLMGLAVNWLAAALLLTANLFYVFIYTIWLKRRTPQNIVIGGAAGAFPPMIGWAAVTGSIDFGALLLFLLIFFWTPPHFWALALYRRGDYARAQIPMMPVVAGVTATKRQILAYSLLLAPLAVIPSAIGITGWMYGIAAATLGAGFVYRAVRVCFDESDRSAKRLFGFSILYLFLIFTALIMDRAGAHFWAGY